jgi:two-component system cell cycle response regulator
MDVLVAHGNDAVRHELAGALEDPENRVFEAADGVAALESLLREDGPKMALLDWDLPRVDGRELCRLLRDFTLGRPIYLILLASPSSGGDIAVGLQAGAHDFVLLPVAGDELRARVGFARPLVEMPWGLASPQGGRAEVAGFTLPGVDEYAAMLRRIDEELARTRRDDAPLSIALVHLEGLDDARRLGGSKLCDAMLREAARRLRASLRPYDGLGWAAGDEFLVTMPKTSPVHVDTVLERLCGILAADPLTYAGMRYSLSATIGGATGCAESGSQLLAAAQAALDAARAQGPDHVVSGPKLELEAVLVQL